uniref:Uncharacterized protein LOC100183253 n=1 Tax=Phallusia mammillata TaxID=59560 RepID=A0A6F9DIJ7_9ASCI|nr:uncharacterized protein LOC100183253 [Phallusia mammillata]
MTMDKPLTLNSICRLTLANAMFKRLIGEEDINKIHRALTQFVSGKIVPNSAVIGILQAFLLCLDSCRTLRVARTQITQETYSKTNSWGQGIHRKDSESEKQGPQRRFKTLLLARHTVHVIMATWTKAAFGQSHLIDSDLPVELTMRMRQWLASYIVDGFLMCHNLCRTSFPSIKCQHSITDWEEMQTEGRCRQRSLEHHNNLAQLDVLAVNLCKEIRSEYGLTGHPMKELDMRASSGNLQCTSTTLNSLKVALEQSRDREDDATDLKPLRVQDMPTIKLEVAMVGSTHNAHSDNLLAVLESSRKHNINISISSFRFDDVTPALTSEIIRNLVDPGLIRQLHFRHVDPTCLFQTKDALRKLTGLEEFSLSTCSFQPVTFNADETATLWNEMIGNWPKLRWLEISRICFTFKSASDVKISPSLKYLEFSEGSLSAEMLKWLTGHFEQDGTIRSLRFVRETALSNRERLWKEFTNLLSASRTSISTLSVDHCCLNDNQCDEMTQVLGSDTTTLSSPPSSLKKLTIREPHTSWRTMSDIFSTVISSSVPLFPKLHYFSALVPRMSEVSQWQRFIVPTSADCAIEVANQGDPRHFYERKLAKLASKEGRHVQIDLCWEPECDWT